MAETSFYTKPPEVLYHYCSVPTFYSIIKNKSIWLSDISKSNDSEELHWYLKTFKEIIDSVWAKYLKERRKNGNRDDANIIKKLRDEIMTDAECERAKSWAFCLSGKRDDLGQWRGYADNGSGIAIGFFSVPFTAAKQAWQDIKKPIYSSITNPRFGRVVYGKNELENSFRDTPEFLKKNLLEWEPPYAAFRIRDIIPELYKIAPFFKNEGFREENEWRIIYSVDMDSLLSAAQPVDEPPLDPDFPGFYATEYAYSERNASLVSHVVFTNRHFEASIAEIIIGPKCKLTETEVKLFLASSGFFLDKDSCDIKISKSASSYR